MRSVKVSVPASSGNLGSGFDVLAASLDLRLELEVAPASRGPGSLEIVGEGVGRLPAGRKNLVARILAKHLADRPVRVRMHNRIPLSRGLGSSGAARLAAHAAGLALSGADWRKALDLATRDEGHPDNVAASFYGGLTAVLCREPLDVYKRAMPAELKAVVCVPAFELSTELAREVLPEEVPMEDAVFNLSRALGWLVALQTRSYDRLRTATQDSLHQPYRASLVPGLRDVIAAALKTGAYGACLSGAGPSVLAVCGRSADLERIGRAMVRAFHGHGVEAASRILPFESAGLRLQTA
jgi:homoserine kinase